MNAPLLPSLYNPRTQSDDTAFVDAFVARHALLETLLRRLRGAESNGLGLHHILIGPRGMGKTSLLRRIAIAIGRESELSGRFIPLSFREEQYNVLSLGDFWRNCGESLAEWAEREGQAALARRLDDALLTEAWANDEGAADQFSAEMRALGRQAVLLVDNLDLILDALPQESDWALRRRLQARGGPILIGASTHALRQAADRDAAFYEFFQPAYLEPLDDRETEHCMRALARRGGEHGAQVIHILNTQPERLRTLHNLTGGNPRVLALIYRLLGTGESAAAMADLELLLDQVTPYYKAKIEEYQTAQQKAVIDAIALHWDPVTTGELARLTRVPATTLSPLLIRLRKDGLIESVELSGAYDGHQLVERFLNIWYLMRNGTRRTKQRMRWLVAFLTSFYSLNELTDIAARAPDRTTWQPDHLLAFDEAQKRLALRAHVVETSHPAMANVAVAILVEALALSSQGNNTAAIAHYDKLVARYADVHVAEIRESVAMALFNKAVLLGDVGDHMAAIATYDELLDRYADTPEPRVREQVAKALVNKAVTLGQIGDVAAEIALYDVIVARFADGSESELRESVARALFYKAVTLRQAGDGAAAINLYDEVVARFADSSGTGLRRRVAMALVNKAVLLREVGENSAAIAVFDEVGARFASAAEPEVRERAAIAMANKASLLNQMGNWAAAIMLYDDVLARYSNVLELETIAAVLFSKAITLGTMGDKAAEIAIYDEVISRFADDSDSRAREAVAAALFNKAVTFSEIGNKAAEISIYDEIAARFSDASQPAVQEQVAKAAANKAFALSQMGDRAAAINLYDEVLARFGGSPEHGLREHVAMALVNKAVALGEMGDSAAEIALYDELLARFGDASEPGLREQVALSLFIKALRLRDAGQISAAIDTLRQSLQRASDVTSRLTLPVLTGTKVALANMLLDWQGDLVRPEALYREVAATNPVIVEANLAWLYLLADRMPEARRELLVLNDLPPDSLALLNAGIDLASDNFGSATSHLAIALEGDLHEAGINFDSDFERLLRLAHQKGYGERLIAWFEQTTFADKLAPIYVAFKAYVRTESLLLDVNPEIRGPARVIYNRLDSPRRHAVGSAPKQLDPQRRARNNRRRRGS